MKEGAENVERKIQAKVESLKNASDAEKGKSEFSGLNKISLFSVLNLFQFYFIFIHLTVSCLYIQ